MEIGRIDLPSHRGVWCEAHVDTGGAKTLDTGSRDLAVGIDGAHHDPADAGVD
jgi:hypothetical protein